jgi:predicted transcriptional regulator
MKIEDAWGEIKRIVGLADTGGDVTRLDLAVGKVARIETLRSGTFRDENGSEYTFTPAHFSDMVANFDKAARHRLKLGHKAIQSDTPNMGAVVGIEYDEGRDRLVTLAQPTESLVEKNRKGEFDRVSAELDYYPKADSYRYRNLGFVGAADPAVSGLGVVALCAPEGEPISVALSIHEEDVEAAEGAYFRKFTADQRKKSASAGTALPDGSYPIENEEDLSNAVQAVGRASDPAAAKAHIIKRAKAMGKTTMLPDGWTGKMAASAGKENPMEPTESEKALRAELAKQREETATIRVGLARDDAERFMASEAIVKRVPYVVRAKVASLVAALAKFELAGDASAVKVEFSEGEGEKKTKTEVGPYGAIKAILSNWPEQLTTRDGRQIATDPADGGTEDVPQVAAFVDLDVERLPMYQAIEKIRKAEKIDFSAAYHRYMETQRRNAN